MELNNSSNDKRKSDKNHVLDIVKISLLILLIIVFSCFCIISLVKPSEKNNTSSGQTSDTSSVSTSDNSYSSNTSNNSYNSNIYDNIASNSKDEDEEDSALTEIINQAAEDYHDGKEHDYVINRNTKKFHLPSCSYISLMKESNRMDVHTTRENLIDKGYSACQKCYP